MMDGLIVSDIKENTCKYAKNAGLKKQKQNYFYHTVFLPTQEYHDLYIQMKADTFERYYIVFFMLLLCLVTRRQISTLLDSKDIFYFILFYIAPSLNMVEYKAKFKY